MWVFGYGSLMWDGWEHQFGCARTERAQTSSFRRDFNKASTYRWGTKNAPGPTLGLEPAEDAVCAGTAFELHDDRSEEVIRYLREREGDDFTLEEHSIQLSDGSQVIAIVPVNHRTAATYCGAMTIAQRASMARVASGKAGNCRDYVSGIREKLISMGVHDRSVEEFWSAIAEDENS